MILIIINCIIIALLVCSELAKAFISKVKKVKYEHNLLKELVIIAILLFALNILNIFNINNIFNISMSPIIITIIFTYICYSIISFLNNYFPTLLSIPLMLLQIMLVRMNSSNKLIFIVTLIVIYQLIIEILVYVRIRKGNSKQ